MFFEKRPMFFQNNGMFIFQNNRCFKLSGNIQFSMIMHSSFQNV